MQATSSDTDGGDKSILCFSIDVIVGYGVVPDSIILRRVSNILPSHVTGRTKKNKKGGE